MSNAILAVLLAVTLQAPPGRASLQGRVIRAGTGDPVPIASIVLAKVAGTIGDYRVVKSDAGGNFTFRDLASGSYRVYADREGYLRTEYGKRPAGASGIPISVGEAENVQGVVVPMTQTGVISGRVMDAGKPRRDVWVRALKASYRDGVRGLGMTAYASTNDLGEYRIFGLPPGLYFLSAIPQRAPRIEDDTYVVAAIASNANNNQSQVRTPGSQILADGMLDPAALDKDIYAMSFYPGTSDPATAAPVQVHAGTVTNGVDLTVARSSGVRVRGRVIDGATGQAPAQPANVRLVSRSPDGAGGGSAELDKGSFEISAVPPGSYTLAAGTIVPPVIYGNILLEVGDKDLENLTVVVQRGTTLQGRVTLDGAPPGLNNPELSGVLVQLMGTAGMFGYSAAPLRADGTFVVENVDAREYRFRVLQGARQPYVKAARFGPDDVLEMPIRIHAETQGRQLEIVLGLSAGTINAQVVDGNQRPVAGVIVAAVPDATARRNRSDLYRTGTTDASGRVRIEGVVPGDYKLFASGNVEAAGWQDPDILRPLESRGVSVKIAEGETREIVLRELQ